jgi:glycosyltransferase involved in cell wall biosynthesis
MKKVAIIETVGGHGGLDYYLHGLYSSILSYDIKPTLYTNEKTIRVNTSCIIKRYYKKIYGEENTIIRGIRFIIGTCKTLIDCMKNRVDLVHLHMFHFNLREYIIIKLFKLARFKILITVHDVECFEKFSRKQSQVTNYNKFLKKKSTIIVHTEFAKKELLGKIDSKKHIFVVPGYDTDSDRLYENRNIPKWKARHKANLPYNKQIILFFGHIKKTKGLEILIDAFPRIISENNNALLVIIGKVWKDNFSNYENQISDYNLEEHVITRIKFIPNREVSYYLKGADLITLPYTKVYNSSVLIRSMSLGVPIVCSDSGPFREFIEHGHNGFIFENGNVEQCAEVICEALSNKERLLEIGKNASVDFDRMFALSKVGVMTSEAYKNALR